MLKQKTGKPESIRIKKGKALVYVPASHEQADDPGTYKKILVAKDELPDGLIQMVNLAKIPPGKSFRPHFHEDMTEVFVIISGNGVIKSNRHRRKIGSDDLVIVRPRETHEIRNTGKGNFKYLVFGISKSGKGRTVVKKTLP